MPAVPMPDADTTAFLDNARAKAEANLKGQVPDSMLSPIPTSQHVDISAKGISNGAPPPPPGPVSDPSDTAQEIAPEVADTPAPPPSPAAIAPPKFSDALGESAQAVGSEIGNGLMRGATNVARTLGFAASGLQHLVTGDSDEGKAADDAIFGFIKNHVDTAYDYWKADPNARGSSGASKFLGQQAEGLAPMLLGGAAAPLMIGDAAVRAGSDSIDRGDDVTTAATLALINGVGSAAQLGIRYKDPSAIKRLAKFVGAGEAYNAATDALTKYVINNEAYKKTIEQIRASRGDAAAAQAQQNLPGPGSADYASGQGDAADAASQAADPLDPSKTALNAITQAVFGIIHDPHAPPKIKAIVAADGSKGPPPGPGAAPPGDLDLSAAQPEPLPPVAGATDLPGTPPPPGAASPSDSGFKIDMTNPADIAAKTTPGAAPVPDKPSAEPASDLKAQWRDMNDKDTPRTGVLVTPGTDTTPIKGGIAQATKQNRVLDLDQGTLIFKSKKLADDAKAQLAAGADPQAVIGKATGAGDGKTADQTAVVQGQDAQGNVSKESMVAPGDIPGAVAAVQAENKTPVVTTPQAATDRRANIIKRQAVADMTPDEKDAEITRLRQERVTNPVSGIPNKTAFEEAPDLGHVAHIDLDNFKSINDVAGHEAGNDIIKAAAQALHEESGGNAYHISGDEYKLRGKSPEELHEIMQRVDDRLSKARIDLEMPDGRKLSLNGIGMSYGVGADSNAAESGLQTNKADRQNSGRRSADRGALPPGAIVRPLEAGGKGDEGNPPSSEPQAQAVKAGDRRLVKIGGQDVPVIVAGSSKDGKVPVHLVDEDGRKSKLTQNVPEHMFGEQTPTDAAPVATSPSKGGVVPASAEPATPAHPLQKIIDATVGGERGPLKDHAMQTEALAKALKAEADKLPDGPIKTHALEAIAPVARIGQKSETAYTKGQGVSHKMLDAHTENLIRAAKNIMDPEHAVIPDAPVVTKTKLKPVADKDKPSDVKLAEKIEAAAPAEDPKVTDYRNNRDKIEGSANVADFIHFKKFLGADWKDGLEDRSLEGQRAHALKVLDEKFPGEADAAKQADARSKDESEKAQNSIDAAGKVSSGIEDVEDATKPKRLNRGEEVRVSKAVERYRDATDHNVDKAHDDLEAMLHEIYGDSRAHEVQNMMLLAREQRADAVEDRAPKKPRRMSDDAEDELGVHGIDYREPNIGDEIDALKGHGELANVLKNSPMGKLHTALQGSGLWKALGKARDAGQFASTHKTLDHLIDVAKRSGNDTMAGLLTKIRARSADLPIRPVSTIVDPRTGQDLEGTAGLFHGRSNSIQVKINDLSNPDHAVFQSTHALIHEITHGVTRYEQLLNPNGALAKESKALLAEANRRAALMPDNVHSAAKYGLTDPGEFVAELTSNPAFQQFLRDSEVHAQDNRGLLQRGLDAVRKFFGVVKPQESKLLNDSMAHLDRLMDANKRMMDSSKLKTQGTSRDVLRNMEPDLRDRLRSQDRAPVYETADHMPGLDHALDTISRLQDPPKPLPEDEETRSIVGDHATQVSRLFRQAVRSGSIEAIRNDARSFTGLKQLIRVALRRGVFGNDDSTNVVRQYHEVMQGRDTIINRAVHDVGDIVNDWSKLSRIDNRKLGRFMQDSTMYKIDPTINKADVPVSVSKDKKFNQRWQDFQDRWKGLTDQQRDIYTRARDANEKLMRANRKAGIDAALDTFSEHDVPKAARSLLYSVSEPHEYEDLIGGRNKVVDFGPEANEKIIDVLKDLAGTHELDGPYFHLGRVGDHVVQATPEGTRVYKDPRDAEAFAARVRELSPNSTATVKHIGDEHHVDYKADFVSMHESPAAADKAVEELRAAGIDVGSHTFKLLSAGNENLSDGITNLIAAAKSKLERNGQDSASAEAVKALHQSFVQLMAAKSAYAASKLARKNVGGVKPEEMLRNFATHSQSVAWNTGHLATAFKMGDALGKIRDAVKDGNVPQAQASARGRFYQEMSKRLAQENKQYGQSVPLNATIAKLGFMHYMTSLSHSFLYLTQNFSTSIPVAGARYGGFKSANAFMAAMGHISGPTFRETYRSVGFKQDADKMMEGIIAGVQKSERFGKWAQGENSPLQQLLDRGAIHTSMSNQLAETAKGGNATVNRAMEWARILPSAADMFNRVSTGLAMLELTKGDVYKAADFISETHMDYSQSDKPRAFRAFSKIPFGNSVTMFRTYTQGMAHLLYSHAYDAAMGTSNGGRLGGREQGLKTVAGMVLGATLFAGVQKGMGLEPIRAAMWAYNKIAGDSDEYYDFDNMTRKFVADATGDGMTTDVINHGLPALAGIDISSRMGLSDLFLHDPPDLSSMDLSKWASLGAGLLGPAYQEMQEEYQSFSNAYESGRMSDMAKVLPVKIVRNVLDAYDAGTTGKLDSMGTPITEPSASAAAIKGFGFKTTEEAKLAEKANTDYEYNQWGEAKKQQYIKNWLKADPEDRGQIFADAQSFGLQNPSFRITQSQLLKRLQTERLKAVGISKDRVVNQLNDY